MVGYTSNFNKIKKINFDKLLTHIYNIYIYIYIYIYIRIKVTGQMQ